MSDIVGLNNYMATVMSRRQTHEPCKKVLSIAITAVRRLVLGLQNVQPEQDLAVQEQEGGRLSYFFVPNSSETASTEDNDDKTGFLALFDQPLQIPLAQIATTSKTLTTSSQLRLLVVTLYNLGLLLHKEGIRNGKSKLLHKSTVYYKTSLNMLQVYLDCSAIQTQQDTALMLALWNNMGHAQALLAQYEQVHVCTAEIQRIIESICRNIPAQELELEEDLFQFWYLASIGGMMETYTLAPAA